MSEVHEATTGAAARIRRSLAKQMRRVLTAVGVGIFLSLVYRIGWQTILDNITGFGRWFAVILAVQMVWVVVQALAWSLIHNGLFRHAPLWLFVRVKIISDTMNTILPAANLGGDAMRAFLIKSRIPLHEGIPGILVDKAVESIAGILFMALGMLGAVLYLPIPRVLLIPAAVSLPVLLAVVALLFSFLFHGFHRSATALLGWIPAMRRLFERKESQLRMLDENMRRFSTQGGVRIAVVLGLHLLSRIVGVVEVIIVLRVLDQPVSFLGAWFISAAVTLANTILFMVPGHWGVQEGAYVLVLKALSFSGSAGLSLAIIRRIRRLFLIGFGLLLLHRERGAAATTR